MLSNQILSVLEHRRGNDISQNELAEQLGATPVAVQKAIDQLRADGISIDTSPNFGYSLRAHGDSLTVSAVQSGLHTQYIGKELLIFQEIDSTNTLLKRSYASAPHGFTVIAEHQTAGRGRLGRSFLSPARSGLYMSILLRPQLSLAHLNDITIAAAISVCHAVEDLCGFLPGIKWVNDIFMDNKKLCGILTEASINGETGAVDFAILGMGINVTLERETIPEDIRAVAACLADFCPKVPHRAALASAVLNHVETNYCLLCEQGPSPLIHQYRELLCMLNRSVSVRTPNSSYRAHALDVNEEGHLLVQTEDGKTHVLSSGEISIRL